MYLINWKNWICLTILVAATNLFSYCQASFFSITGGTTIITVITKDSIWIAADSKQTDKIVGESPDTKHVLKIGHWNNIFFSIAGSFCEIKNPKKEVVFNADSLMLQLLGKYKNLDSAFDYFGIIAVKKIDSVLNLMPSKLAEEIKSQLDNKQMELVMVTFKDKTPVYRFSDFAFMRIEDSVVFKSNKQITKSEIPFIHFSGFSSEIYRITNSLNYRWSKNIKNDLIDLIKKEEAANPDFVGTPVDIVVIFNDSYKWLTNNKYEF